MKISKLILYFCGISGLNTKLNRGLFFIFILLILSLNVNAGISFHTGQTVSYNNYDDAYLDGVSKAFIDGGCGTGTVLDPHTNLCWTKADNGATVAWTTAVAYCPTLSTGGYYDWYLPNILELSTMIDYSRTDYQNPAFTWAASDSVYWSSTTSPKDTAKTFFVSTSGGHYGPIAKTSTFYARCVREW